MKSTLKVIAPKEKELKFPLLARSKIYDHVVLFTNNTSGTVVTETQTMFPVGYYNDTWVMLSNDAAWEILPAGSEVTLIQE